LPSILQQIQGDCAGALVADPFFANVPVLTERLQDPGSRVDLALNSLGACVSLATPVATVRRPNQPGPYFERVRIVARVVEHVAVNQNTAAGGTGKGALEIAEHVCAVLHHFRPQSLSETVVCDDPTIELAKDPGRLAYDVNFQTQGGLAYALPVLDLPSITQAGGTIAIALAASSGVPVPGAATFYTTDGTWPAPRNGALYTAPFAATPGQTVRASAWLAGYLSSPFATLIAS
jgi:hypothetical protein